MHARGLILILLSGLAVFSAFVLTPAAQFGEQGWQPHFQVQVGHNETLPWVLLNEGNSSIGFQIQIESISQQDNQTTPTIAANPAYGMVPPHGDLVVNLTVFMPLNDTPGAVSWSTIASAVEASNASNPGGAVLQAGVAKIVSIGAIASTTSTSTIAQRAVAAPIAIPTTAIIAGAGVAIAAGIGGGAYYMLKKKKPRRPARRRKATARPRKKAARRKPARRRTSRKARTATRRRTTRRR